MGLGEAAIEQQIAAAQNAAGAEGDEDDGGVVATQPGFSPPGSPPSRRPPSAADPQPPPGSPPGSPPPSHNPYSHGAYTRAGSMEPAPLDVLEPAGPPPPRRPQPVQHHLSLMHVRGGKAAHDSPGTGAQPQPPYTYPQQPPQPPPPPADDPPPWSPTGPPGLHVMGSGASFIPDDLPDGPPPPESPPPPGPHQAAPPSFITPRGLPPGGPPPGAGLPRPLSGVAPNWRPSDLPPDDLPLGPPPDDLPDGPPPGHSPLQHQQSGHDVAMAIAANSASKQKRGGYRASAMLPEAPVVHSGYLEKRGKMMAGWQRRFCEIAGHYLRYYKDEHKEQLLATLDLRAVSLHQDALEQKAQGGSRVFSIVPDDGSKPMALRARDIESASQWLALLRSIKKGTPPMVL